MKEKTLNIVSIILDPTLNKKVHLIPFFDQNPTIRKKTTVDIAIRILLINFRESILFEFLIETNQFSDICASIFFQKVTLQVLPFVFYNHLIGRVNFWFLHCQELLGQYKTLWNLKGVCSLKSIAALGRVWNLHFKISADYESKNYFFNLL